MNLEGFSIPPLAEELNSALRYARIDKITQPSKSVMYFAMRKPGENLLLCISAATQNPAVYLTKNQPENPSEPPTFCMVLRKQLESGRIAGVRERKGDRIIEMDIDTIGAGGKIITKTLIIELMGKNSNIILTENNIVIDALRKVGAGKSKTRIILPNNVYIPPAPQEKFDLREDDIESIIKSLKNKKESPLLAAIIDTVSGFGKIHAKEACYLSGLPTGILINSLDDADFLSLKSALLEIKNAKNPTIILNENNKILAIATVPINCEQNANKKEFSTISEMLEYSSKLTYSYIPPDKERFQKLVKNELTRAKNKLLKLEKELSDAENAEIYKIKADNLMTYQYDFKDHEDAKIKVQNIYSETGETIEITLNKRFTILENMQNFYKKYDKLKRAKAYLTEQILKNKEEISYLESVENSLESSNSLSEINDIQRELVAGHYLKEKAAKKNNEKQAKPFLFTAKDGAQILVGKNNAQNDILTFKTAAPTDVWLHTKDIPGSHIIIRRPLAEISEDTLLLAGNFAVYFSKAKGSNNVPVDMVECKYIKKPSGSKPGFVTFTHQKTIAINADEALLEEYLKGVV